MTELSKTWPAWFYGPGEKAEIFERAEDVPAGWQDHPSKVTAAKPAPTPAPAASGSEAKPPKTGKAPKVPTPLGEARKAYKLKFGKNPGPKLTLDEINAKLAAPIDL